MTSTSPIPAVKTVLTTENHRAIFCHFFNLFIISGLISRLFIFQKLDTSECLAQRHKNLIGLKPGRRIDEVSYIKAYWPHRRLIAQSCADCTSEIGKNVAETKAGVNVSSVIEDGPAQRATNQRHGNPKRKAQLGIKNY